MTTLDFVLGMTLFFVQDGAFAALEKRAVAAVQQMTASQLDSQLPDRSFSSWFNQVVGAQSGVNWQLTDCGGPTGASADRERDLPYCVEVVAITQNDRKVVANILVGSAKRGVGEKPQLYFAVVEHKGEFYKLGRLSELPALLTKPLKPKPRPVALPDVKSKKSPTITSAYVRSAPVAAVSAPSLAVETQPPPAPARNTGAKNSLAEMGEAITKVLPEYPTTARQVAAPSEVKVRVIISEQGHVLEASAISGHTLLRRPAETAALKWVFKPAISDGKAVKAEGTIIFVFKRE